MSIKFNESLSKKLNYHQKSGNTKTSVSTGNTYSKTNLLSSKGHEKAPTQRKENYVNLKILNNFRKVETTMTTKTASKTQSNLSQTKKKTLTQ